MTDPEVIAEAFVELMMDVQQSITPPALVGG